MDRGWFSLGTGWATESGWMDAYNFLSWFTKVFIPAVSHLTATAPVVLFLDGHHFHISSELIKGSWKQHFSSVFYLTLCICCSLWTYAHLHHWKRHGKPFWSLSSLEPKVNKSARNYFRVWLLSFGESLLPLNTARVHFREMVWHHSTVTTSYKNLHHQHHMIQQREKSEQQESLAPAVGMKWQQHLSLKRT